MTSINIVFAEAGGTRGNAGDAALPASRLEPSLSSFRKHFPEATFTVYTDQPKLEAEGCDIRFVSDPPFDKKHSRYGWRFNDFYGPFGLLESQADIRISIDSDLFITSKDVRSIIPLTQKFGCCSPSNGRHIVWKDARAQADGGIVADESLGCGQCHCTAFISLRRDYIAGRHLMKAYCDQLIADAATNNGARGPLSLWRASWKTGIAPYTLPREWCITGSNLGDSAIDGRPIPIVLHYGHESVQVHYASLIEAERNR